MPALAAKLGPVLSPGDAARILVVDDEDVVRMLVVDLLRERGYTVEEAEDAYAAMDMLQGDEAFDLMVTDIGLPGGFDGSTLARRARVIHPGLPILFITGYAFGANGDITLEPGIPVLTKPFTLTALSTQVRDLLARRENGAGG
jgi:CheY-like chemotaxis protein